jgi:hypothetical protein
VLNPFHVEKKAYLAKLFRAICNLHLPNPTRATVHRRGAVDVVLAEVDMGEDTNILYAVRRLASLESSYLTGCSVPAVSLWLVAMPKFPGTKPLLLGEGESLAKILNVVKPWSDISEP